MMKMERHFHLTDLLAIPASIQPTAIQPFLVGGYGCNAHGMTLMWVDGHANNMSILTIKAGKTGPTIDAATPAKYDCHRQR